tara:strand:- start:1048 stop:1746 length:699 start_codon:yes stop_codon:yes gene_type:complete
MNFVKKVFNGEIDESVHTQFTRFGKGDYKGRFPLSIWKTKKVKIRTSFEFANDLFSLCSKFGGGKVSGLVLSKKEISNVMKENNIQGNSEEKRSGLYYQNNIPEQELEKEQLIELGENAYFVLLDIEGEDFKLKTKKKLPKPGKSEGKIDDKFCQLEADEKYYSKIKEDFFWDMPDSKKINVKHEVIINELILPKDEKDFAKIRELAKRKGKIIRKAVIDDKETEKEIDFEA